MMFVVRLAGALDGVGLVGYTHFNCFIMDST